MPLGERMVQPKRTAVGIAVQLRRSPLHRLERGGKRAQRAFVRGQLDDTVDPEPTLHLLDGRSRLVGAQPFDGAPEERLGEVPGLAAHQAGPYPVGTS